MLTTKTPTVIETAQQWVEANEDLQVAADMVRNAEYKREKAVTRVIALTEQLKSLWARTLLNGSSILEKTVLYEFISNKA